MAVAAFFPHDHGDSKREGFLPHADVWMGWSTRTVGAGGPSTLHFFPAFRSPILKREVGDIQGLTPTSHQYNLEFIDVHFYLYWKKKKQNEFLLIAALQR